MKILALEPYYGGSHQAFLDGWQARSRHEWTSLTLPPSKWKWRMRHAAITFAQQIQEKATAGESWDGLFCSDMLNLAEFLGLTDESIRTLPKVVYFHENQLTYPVRFESERDYQFAMTNLTTALAADAVWFNSAFHREDFLRAAESFINKMPDYKPLQRIDEIRRKSEIQPPGIHISNSQPTQKNEGPVRILWAARWEHDKNPDDFFEAMKILKDRGLPFRLSVIGQQFRDRPEVFDRAAAVFADRIDRWGFQPTPEAYHAALAESDIAVSTAAHEFFGIGILEAVAAGCLPLLPRRLSYPEILRTLDPDRADDFLYDGTAADLANKLTTLIQSPPAANPFARAATQKFGWPQRAGQMDSRLDSLSAPAGAAQ